jgi:gluconolactonase
MVLQHNGFAQKNTASEILAPNGTVKEIFSAGETFLEGPTMSPDGLLYFSDIALTNGKPGKAGIIWSLNPVTGESRVFRSPSGMSNGLMFDAAGNLIACEGADFGGRRVTRTDMRTGKSEIIAGLYQGKPFNAPNDLAIDERGRIYFTDPRYIGAEPVEQFVMGVYRIDTDGSIHLVAANVNKPNGILVSPDQKTLYVANSDYPGNGNMRFLPDSFAAVKPIAKGSVLAYDLLQDGTLRFKSTFIDYGARGPDGMAIDVEGNLYIAMGNIVEVYSQQGKKISEIKAPAATNLCFGRGQFSRTLFIAGGKSIYTVETRKEGYNIPFTKAVR